MPCGKKKNVSSHQKLKKLLLHHHRLNPWDVSKPVGLMNDAVQIMTHVRAMLDGTMHAVTVMNH